MSPEPGESVSEVTYELACTDCAYEATVDGTVHDALDVAEAHEEEYGGVAVDHFVNLETRE